MPVFKITSPDGAIYNVTAPEGATEQDALAKVQAQHGIPQPKEQPPIGPAIWDTFKSGLASTAAIPGMVADVGSLIGKGVRRTVGLDPNYVDNPLANTEAIYKPVSKTLGVQHLPTPTNEYGKPSKSNEYLMALANFAGASALPGVGVVSAAERKLMAALVETAATAISATSSVEGKELAKNLAPTFGVDPERAGHIGEVVGSLAGPGLVAAAGRGIEKATAKTGQVVSDATGLTGVSKEAQQRAGRLMAIRQIGQALDSNIASKSNLKEAVDLQNRIPGFKPTLGQASDAPGVKAIEQTLAGKTPQSLSTAAERQAENQAAVSAYGEQKFPTGEASPTQPVKNLYQGIAADQQKRLDTTNAQISDLAAKSEFQDTAAIGERLRTLRADAKNAAREVKNAKYSDVYDAANKAGLKAPVDDVQSLMREVAGSDANAAQIMPGLYSDLNSAIKKFTPEQPKILLPGGQPQARPPAEVSFEALHSMQKRSNADMGAALAAGDTQKAYLIGKVQDLLKQKVAAFEGPQFGEVGVKLRDANQFYATKYQPVFNEGLGGRTGPAARTKYGEITQDGDIVRKLIFNPENKRGTAEFFDIYGNNPEAHSLLRNGIADMFTKAVVRDGEIKPALVESFMRQHAAQFDMMPSLKSEFSNIDHLNDTLLARRQSLEAQQSLLDKTTIAKIAKSDKPDEVIGRALTNPKEMMALVSQSFKTPEGAQTLANAIAKTVSEQKNPYQFLRENEAALRNGMAPLGKQHFDNLLTLTKAQEVSGRVKAPTSVELDKLQDIGTQAIGTPIKSLLSRIWNVNRAGGPSAKYAAVDVGGRYIYKIKTEEAQKLMEQAIYDPQMAQALLALKNEPSIAKLNNVRNHAFAHGLRVTATAGEPDIEGRAGGGPVNAGQPYIVGENGPEVIVPSGAATVVPQNYLAPGVPSGGPEWEKYMRADAEFQLKQKAMDAAAKAAEESWMLEHMPKTLRAVNARRLSK